MKKILFYSFSLLILNACSGLDFPKYTEHFYSNERAFNHVAEYLNNNYNSLSESPCVDSLYVFLISKRRVESTIEKQGCYPEQEDSLKKILSLELFDHVELVDTALFEFELDFVPHDFLDLESTICLLYVDEGRDLPDYYEGWVGYKKRLNENWWLLENKNAKY